MYFDQLCMLVAVEITKIGVSNLFQQKRKNKKEKYARKFKNTKRKGLPLCFQA